MALSFTLRIYGRVEEMRRVYRIMQAVDDQ